MSRITPSPFPELNRALLLPAHTTLISAAASAAAALLLSAPPTAMATSDRTARLKERTVRSLLSTASQNAAAPTPTEAPTEFAGREDVDALNEKIKGKKRKSDHMIEHNEELQTILAEIGRINGLIYAAGNHQATIAAQLVQEIQGSVAMKEELEKHYASLQESLKKVECLRSYRDEKEARIVAESSRNELSEELSRTQQKRLNDQLEQKCLNDQSEALKLKNNLLNEVEAPRGQFHEVREDTHHKSAEINSLLSELGAYKELMGASVSELENVMIQCDALEETCSNQTEKIQKLQNQLASMTSEYESQKKMSEELKLRLAEAEQKNVDGEKLRKKLHNTILELKGNIRVFCRVRPLLPNEPGAISYTSEVDYIGRRVVLNHNTQDYSFTFDKVFDHLASQEDVFTEISQLVQSALDGHKVCIFAYGQTGSGKTHTMIGNPKLNDQKGIIPRSFEQIFQTSQCSMSQGWKYNMQASLLEIYNETIHDLLATSRTSIQDGAASKYNIKHDTDGNAQVSGLTIVDVQSTKEVSSLLEQAAQRRSVGKTEMNEESSRSHCVFTLRILGVNEGTDQQVQGALNLIDLAGSERVTKSGAIGDRLKETKAINKSLSCLTDVISAIAKKEEHVPFRNSKLTHLLQPCLGGDCKTVMFVNLSPEVSSTSESICSLRFASRVNSCEIGLPRRRT